MYKFLRQQWWFWYYSRWIRDWFYLSLCRIGHKWITYTYKGEVKGIYCARCGVDKDPKVNAMHSGF